jgi:hypothetical protein
MLFILTDFALLPQTILIFSLSSFPAKILKAVTKIEEGSTLLSKSFLTLYAIVVVFPLIK